MAEFYPFAAVGDNGFTARNMFGFFILYKIIVKIWYIESGVSAYKEMDIFLIGIFNYIANSDSVV